MKKRCLLLLLMALVTVGLKAQIYTGSLPPFEEEWGCPEGFNNFELDASRAFGYLAFWGEFHTIGDCDYNFNVECHLFLDEVIGGTITGHRFFTVRDECGHTQSLPRQDLFYYAKDVELNNTELPENTFYGSFSLEEALPNSSSYILSYLADNYSINPFVCWGFTTPPMASYRYMVDNVTDCSNRYLLAFDIWCPGSYGSDNHKITLYQYVTIEPIEDVQCSATELDPIYFNGCDAVPNIGQITSIDRFADYGVVFDNYLRTDIFEIFCEDDYDEINSTCKDHIVNRTYTVAYLCTNQIFTLHQTVHFQPYFSVFRELSPLFYSDDPPEPLSDAELRSKLDIHYSCGLENISIRHVDIFDEDNESMIERWYIIRGTCDELVDSVSQYLFKTNGNSDAFKLIDKHDVSIEGANDGYAELARPSGLYCPSCSNQEEKMFQVVWTNKTTGEIWFGDIEGDIFVNNSLTAGNYEVEVYPICPDFSMDLDKPIYKENFKIGKNKLDVWIIPWVCLYSTNVYPSFISDVLLKDSNGDVMRFDYLNNTFNDEWKLEEGLLYSPNLKEWDLYEMYNPHMGGDGVYERVLDDYQSFNIGGYHSNGLQSMIVAKNERRSVTYRIYKKRGRGEDLGILVKEARKVLFHEELWCSNDPNEIFGPAGYTNADSTCVRMINADDDVAYTIMFENDPEFATAAAARVKVECPLSDKIDATTFRLGQFGFNNMTFEVPELASYYNQRLQLDSLGYWLDVTASIQVPENVAYWIFQTIDPETGVAPIDSLGFLPVNDSLTGCGEGYVTFKASLANSGMHSIQTGEEILEKADIYFDENEVVPTNEYVNKFDAVAPSSHIVCDTTGAYLNQMLPIGFAADDDEGGSGVHHVNLFVNLDNAGYVQVGQIHPDSVYNYPTTNANMLQFFAQAADNVGNLEPLKNLPELVYTQGNPPVGLSLSNNRFEEDAEIAHVIGAFSTLDDQTSDDFSYALVAGEGASHNALFSIVDDKIVTNNDFRCYGTYEYNVRVRTTDLSGLFYEKAFTLYASRTNEIAPTVEYQSICEGESIYFGNQEISTAGTYEHSFTSVLGCDSLAYLQVTLNPSSPTVEYDDAICSNYDYEDNGFSISAEALAGMTTGWSHEADTLLIIDQTTENVHGCFDTTRLMLTLRPAYEALDEHLVCPTDLPFVYQYRPFMTDTTVVFNQSADNGCDSTVVFRLTINPDNGTQSEDLAMGWSWYSTYIDMSNGKGLRNLENALGTDGIAIKSLSKFVQYSTNSGQWVGNLTDLDNDKTYMIQTGSAHITDVFGCFVDPTTVPISLHNGWNWIGFPSAHSVGVDEAFGDTPSNGDVLKSKTSFTTYFASAGVWVGLLTQLQPGVGYLYKSNNASEVEFTYPLATRDAAPPTPLPEVKWMADEHQFANNITFVGLIQLDGRAVESDSLEVGAFCKGEERGSTRAIYLEALDAYRVFLTVQGQDGDTLNFRLYDHNRDKERRIRSRQMEVFYADSHYGSIERPYLFNFTTDYDKLIEAEICEGEYYVANGFREFRQGTYFYERPNDSIIRLDLTVNPVYHIEKEVVAMEFPMQYEGITFNEPGQYNLPFETAELCDSVLVVTVRPFDGKRELLISPVPADRNQRVTLFFPFTSAEQHDLMVEVYTLAGNLVQALKPTRYPVELQPLVASGTYMVRITMGTGEVLTGKFVVQ